MWLLKNYFYNISIVPSIMQFSSNSVLSFYHLLHWWCWRSLPSCLGKGWWWWWLGGMYWVFLLFYYLSVKTKIRKCRKLWFNQIIGHVASFYWWSMESMTKDLDLIHINALILIRNKNGRVIDYEECVLNSLQMIKPHFCKGLMYNFCFNDYFYTLFNSII